MVELSWAWFVGIVIIAYLAGATTMVLKFVWWHMKREREKDGRHE